MRYLFVYTTILPLFISAADAADLMPPFEPADSIPPSVFVEASVPRWDGFYLGILGGGSLTNGEFQACGCEIVGETFEGKHVGVFAGYNWEFPGPFLVGIEGDFSYDWNGKQFEGAGYVGSDASGSLRLRFGETTGRSLLFVAGGWTTTNLYLKGPDDEARADGWTVGAGVDWAATDNMFVRGEYRYNNFSNLDLAGVDSKFDQHVLSIGLAVKF